MFNNTICALATARMNCAIHIIRMSGPQAYEIINKVSSKSIPKQKFKIIRTNIIDNNEIIDDVLINCFVAPHSYTGEDTIEINCHGGVLVADTILNLLVKHGASFASRGEFTKRAMMNKKIDISQTEAINNLIHAQNKYSLKGSVNALTGITSDTLKKLRDKLFFLIGQIEVNIDYPEYTDIEQINIVNAKKTINKILIELKKILINSKRFIPLNEGISVAIVGAPNAGKSTLLNALSQTNKAIVSDIPGTTRDVVESTICIDDITLKLFDTAGIRETSDQIEKLGIEKTKEHIDKVDLVLILKPINNQNDWLDNYDYLFNKKHIIVYTKSDTTDTSINLNNNEVLISAKNNDIDSLIQKIKMLFEVEEFDNSDMNVVQSQRQIALLESIVQLLESSQQKIELLPLDLTIEDYSEALTKFNQILGLDSEYDFLDELFKNFCLGK